MEIKITLSQLEVRIQDGLDQANGMLAQFTAKLADDSAYAFEWCSGRALEAAAAKRVWLVIENIIDNGRSNLALSDEENLLGVFDHAMYEALNARNVTSRSTSVMSNLFEDATVETWRRVIRIMNGRTF